MSYTCMYCKQPIAIMINKGSDHCSENCRKALEHAKEEIRPVRVPQKRSRAIKYRDT